MEGCQRVGNQIVAVADDILVLTAGGAEHQRAVRSVELAAAHLLFDDLRPGQPQAARFAHHDDVGSGSDKPHPAKAADLAANHCHHRYATAQGLQHVHALGVGQQSGVSLMQTHAAGFKGDEDDRAAGRVGGLRRQFVRQHQRADHLGAAHFTHCPPDKAPLLGDDDGRVLAQQADTGDDTVVKFNRLIEHGQVRAGSFGRRADQFSKGAFIHQRTGANPGAGFQKTQIIHDGFLPA